MVSDRELIALTPAHAAVVSALHKSAFDTPSPPDAFADLLAQPVASGWILATPDPVGFILMRQAADEAEILTLVVVEGCRRRGYGRRLVQHALNQALAKGASVCHLEVVAGNDVALSLYAGLGFSISGQRKGYYGSPLGAKGAVLMSCFLARQENTKTQLVQLNKNANNFLQ